LRKLRSLAARRLVLTPYHQKAPDRETRRTLRTLWITIRGKRITHKIHTLKAILGACPRTFFLSFRTKRSEVRNLESQLLTQTRFLASGSK
jgi:hypothetical protein